MEKGGTGVTGFSRLEYVFEIAKCMCAPPLKDEGASISDLVRIVKRVGEERRRRWFIEIGEEVTKGPDKIIYDCIDAMKKKWNLLEPKNDRLLPTDKLTKIGKFLMEKEELKAKHELLDTILRSRMETPFQLSNLIIKIRDAGPDHKIRITFVGRKEKKSKQLDELSPELPFKTEDGMAPDDHNFVKEVLNTNFRAFDIMRDWGIFFELLDYIDLDKEELEKLLIRNTSRNYLKELAKRYSYTSVHINNPSRIVFLTVRIASVEELTSAYVQGINNLKMNSFAQECLRYLLREIRPLKETFTPEELVHLSLNKNVLVVSDGPELYGVISKEEAHRINPKMTYVVIRPQVDITEFRSVVKEAHEKLSRHRPIIPVWVGDLAERVCMKLRISEGCFYDLLLRLAEEKLVSLHKASMFIKGPKRRRRRPIRDKMGRAYQQVSLI